jgi:hypothetical protein
MLRYNKTKIKKFSQSLKAYLVDSQIFQKNLSSTLNASVPTGLNEKIIGDWFENIMV